VSHAVRHGLALLLLWLPLATAAAPADTPWISDGADGRQVHLYFFWSRTCPHCQAALPVLQDLEVSHPWLVLHSYEVTTERANAERYAAMAAALHEQARVVPGFFVCGQLLQGFAAGGEREREILALARDCRAHGPPRPGTGPPAPVTLLPGGIEAEQLSLPVLTLVLAGLDAFNPCAFFVLLFLLSLLIHTRSRGRMLLVGGVFVFCSGLVYFLFMAAWLNLFLVIGSTPWVTTAAGAVALLIGALNTKDFLVPGRGPSLSMSSGARSGLFARMRGLLAVDRLPLQLAGTVLLALAANSYELLCTAGFPMVYTRVLTMTPLTSGAHYGYLLLYNLVYVLPLLLIVLLFTATLGRRKLSEGEGRTLKLMSGLMMLGLGGVLLFAPQALTRLWTGLALLLASVALTWLLRRRQPPGRD